MKDLARAGDYFSEAGAPASTKTLVDKYSNILMEKDQLNHQVCLEFILSSVKGDASYTISFKTQGQQLISCIMLQGVVH